ncbi:hypothetical protein BDW22DRAFT_212744 [Trametopsis cervina]|nr:hypothetical protein BDW22DRAFT_212744 [Trametopsis cervina]
MPVDADTALQSAVASGSPSPSHRHPITRATSGTGSIIAHDVRLGYTRSMSMLSSVFSRRKGLQKKLNSFAHIRRAQSPPSPGSFISPEIGEKPFNPYTLGNESLTSQNSLNQVSSTGTQVADGDKAGSPRVQLQLTTDTLSLSDWFPAQYLQSNTEQPARIPLRNASLGVTGAQASGSRRPQDADVHGGSMEQIAEQGQDLQREDDRGHGHDDGSDLDDVIIIEAPRGREQLASPMKRNVAGLPERSESREASTSGQSRRHTPHPITIPASRNIFLEIDPESASSAHRSSKARTSRSSRRSSKYGSRRNSVYHTLPRKPSKHTSLRKSRHPSLTRPKSRLRSKSRPNSFCSGQSGSEFETDGDDGMSAVSGTTIARALASTYFISASPHGSHPPSSHSYPRSRGHLARQDSATLPKGDYPFLFKRKSQRSSKGSTASNEGRTPNSANYWKDRKINGDQIVVMSPEEREREDWDLDVPPVPPMPEGLSPIPSASAHSSMQKLLATTDPRDSSPVSDSLRSRADDNERLSNSSISRRRATKDLTLDPDPDHKRRRISQAAVSIINSETAPMSTGTLSSSSVQPDVQAGSQISLSSSSVSDDKQDKAEDEPSPRSLTDAHASSPDAPTTATSTSMSIYSEGLHGVISPADSASLYSDARSPGSTAILSPGLTSLISSPGSSSLRTPGSSVTGSAASLDPSFRSFSAARQKRHESPARPAISMLPIGERPRSAQVPHSPSSPNASPVVTRPMSMTGSPRSSVDSPDLLDMMFAGSRGPLARNVSVASRMGSPPAPISVPPRTPFDITAGEGSSASAIKQQFPETPYAFTPLVSAGFPPALPRGVPPPLPRSGTVVIRGARAKRASTSSSVGRKALMRSATLMSPSSSSTVANQASTEPKDDEVADVQEELPPNSSAGLSAIEEGSAVNSPLSQYSAASAQSPMSFAQRAMVDPDPPSYDSLSPIPSRSQSPMSMTTVAASIPLPPSPMPVPTSLLKRKHASAIEGDEDALSVLHSDSEDESPAPSLRPTLSPSPLSVEPHSATADSSTASFQQDQLLRPGYGSIARNTRNRTRPPPPFGPRKPSATNGIPFLNRARSGSTASSIGSPGHSSSTKASVSPASSATMPESTIRFQPTPVKFRGLTMEAAQWTFTSEELQLLVSAAVKQSSDASAIRLLSRDVLQTEIPDEIARLEKLSTELKTRYKQGMRKRTNLLSTLQSLAGSSDLPEQTASARHLEELLELTDHLDHIAEEMHSTTDQLRQLEHLRDVHASSALAMAVRKLNASFVKHLAEKEALRQQVTDLESERDEAWAQAQEAAKELDSLTEKMAVSDGVMTPASSRRSSAVVVARKASVRKAGLRARSQRSSIATNRSSSAISPATRTASSAEFVPPLPPIPVRTPVGLFTAGLSTGVSIGSGRSTDDNVRAMIRAQEELYEMLGIKLDDTPTARKRSMSVSDALYPPPYQWDRPRRNSDCISPAIVRSAAWHDHRTAVMASIGMSH